MLLRIREELAKHEDACDRPAKAILMNPGNFDLIGWDEVLGLPVLPDEKVKPMRAHILCGVGRGGLCDEGSVYWDEQGGAYVKIDQAR